MTRPVQEGVAGERVRIEVGPIKQTAARTFVFDRRLQGPSKLIQVVLPRPMGVIFEEDARHQQAVVVGFVKGSIAEQKMKVAKMNSSLLDACPKEGDILRACTCTTFVANALKRGDKDDGLVSLVLERPLEK
eukprot:jgi/Astpho2/963/Aster-x0035